jgi:hypothetical protein
MGVRTPPQRQHPSLPGHNSGSQLHILHQLTQVLTTVARLRAKATQQAAAAEALQALGSGATPVVLIPPPAELLPFSSVAAAAHSYQQEEGQEATDEQQADVVSDSDMAAAQQPGSPVPAQAQSTPSKQQQAQQVSQQQQQEVKRAWDLSKAWVAAENSHRASIARLHEEEMSRQEQLHRWGVQVCLQYY